MKEIIEYEDTDTKKKGGLTFKKCLTCGDLSRTTNLGASFCINQHRDSDGNEIQPRSIGSSMSGKEWSQTPEGKKKR